MRDGWHLEEWRILLANDRGCFIYGCESFEIDERGPIFLDNREMHKACPKHWEALRLASVRTEAVE